MSSNNEGRRVLIQTKISLFLARKKDPILNEALNDKIKNQLVERLYNGTVCGIVESLKDLQQLKEEELFEAREQRLMELRQQGLDEAREIHDFDFDILRQIDDMVTEQQNHMSAAHVPLFHVTKDPKAMRIQMALMELIESLIPLFNN